MTKINLGDRVKDPISGFQGIAIGRVQWLHGCDRIIVQPEKLDKKDGKPLENHQFDEPGLVVLKPKKVKEGSHKKGGFDIRIKEKTI